MLGSIIMLLSVIELTNASDRQLVETYSNMIDFHWLVGLAYMKLQTKPCFSDPFGAAVAVWLQ
jgi:hypothetical protein